uniref:SER_THR_PHOSPHATASE domain-containing protein n=1 Tax=Steinernema glaseri TaxID=37863 RepID=A0A1I7YA75_9BILA
MGNSASSKASQQNNTVNSAHQSNSATASTNPSDDTHRPSSTTPSSSGSGASDPILNLQNEDITVDMIIRGIWAFIFSYTDGPPPQYNPRPLLTMLEDAEDLLKDEKTVLDLPSPQCIVGDLHGQGDTLITLLSLVDTPPAKSYLFLGNYAGQGFAPHETLFLLLALKVKYPYRVHLLRGNLEDVDVLKAQGFISGLTQRNLTNDSFVWSALERIIGALPLAAIIDNRYFCVHGGIGPELQKGGIERLKKVQRPPIDQEDQAITLVGTHFSSISNKSFLQECQWAVLRLKPPNKLVPQVPEMLLDGSPIFHEEDVDAFCKRNRIHGIIRSRQLANQGVLALPLQMLTVWSAVAYLDNFRNFAAVLIVEANSMSIVRYKQVDSEPGSLDDKKPVSGRNAMII